MNGPFKMKYKNVEGSTKKLNIRGLNLALKTTKKSKLKIGTFVKGSGTGIDKKIIAGGEIGYQGKHGNISLKPTILSESSKHHSFMKPDLKLGVSFSPSQVIKNIKKKFKG